MPIELRDLARLPPSIENMAFSKIRVERLSGGRGDTFL